MKIREDQIGRTISTHANNGSHFNVVIEDKPEKFKLYKALGLDVFEDMVPAPRKKPEDMEVDELLDYVKFHGIKTGAKTKKGLLNAITKERQ